MPKTALRHLQSLPSPPSYSTRTLPSPLHGRVDIWQTTLYRGISVTRRDKFGNIRDIKKIWQFESLPIKHESRNSSRLRRPPQRCGGRYPARDTDQYLQYHVNINSVSFTLSTKQHNASSLTLRTKPKNWSTSKKF